MKLRAKDQVHLSAVKRDSLRSGEEFEVSDATGEELLKARPNLFERVEDVSAEKAAETHADKARKPASNKARKKKTPAVK